MTTATSALPRDTAIPARCGPERQRVERILLRWQRSLEAGHLVLSTGEFLPAAPTLGPLP